MLELHNLRRKYERPRNEVENLGMEVLSESNKFLKDVLPPDEIHIRILADNLISSRTHLHDRLRVRNDHITILSDRQLPFLILFDQCFKNSSSI